MLRADRVKVIEGPGSSEGWTSPERLREVNSVTGPWALVSEKTPEQSGFISNVDYFPVTIFLCLQR